MRNSLIVILVAAFIGLSGCQRAAAPIAVSNQPVSINDRPTTDRPAATKPLGEMSWTDDEARVQKLADLKGKAVILDFWATFCPPCRKEIPHLNSLIAKYGKENLHVVGLNVGGADDKPEIPKFIQTTRLDYPIAYPEDDLSRFIFADQDDIPQTAIFDRQGRMIAKIVGFGPEIQKKLDEAVEKAVQSEPAT
jgi:cytochrome c biogenesis protein CcmG/thiol:disulfide interchange protein DsbE